MNIDVNVKVDEEKIASKVGNVVASGWVEIENCIKFPVKVRKYIEEGTGKEKLFVSYPQRKNGNRYEGIIYPHDVNVRKEIEETVLERVTAEIMKGIDLPVIEQVRVSKLEQFKASSVVVRGIATIKIAGMTINGIMVKEGRNGLFVQMPQYKSGTEYKDTVYGTNAGIHALIKDEVLKSYEEVVKEGEEKEEEQQKDEKQQTEQKEKEEQKESVERKGYVAPILNAGIDRFIQAFQENDIQSMMDVFAEAEIEIGNAKFTENGNAVKLQGAVIADENRMVELAFYNSWNPLQQTPPEDYLKQSIDARIFEAEKCIGIFTLVEKKTKSLKNAEKNYQEVLSLWKKLTNQEKIEIPREQQKQEVEMEKRYAAPGL